MKKKITHLALTLTLAVAFTAVENNRLPSASAGGSHVAVNDGGSSSQPTPTPCDVAVLTPTPTGDECRLKTFQLKVDNDGSGRGTVNSSPAGINCGTTCRTDYQRQTRVTLTATPATGSTFAGWSGSCSGMFLTCTITMDHSRQVKATFRLADDGAEVGHSPTPIVAGGSKSPEGSDTLAAR